MAYYKDLIVWQKSLYVAERVYRLTRTFPATQRYSLCDQMERSAVSIMSNIAEGSRRSKKRMEEFYSYRIRFRFRTRVTASSGE